MFLRVNEEETIRMPEAKRARRSRLIRRIAAGVLAACLFAAIAGVIASEDSGFFEHEGLDYLGMLRCAVKNLFSGRIACGASTITQQTVKTFLLSPKQT